ncbi:MAG: phosphatidylserine decarboxylase family protein [Acidaminococcaceae bacterium]|nr:phosphatidylserine decarboxylase family protein [Acidaminococcaceae bacterium]MBQ7418439.1 phosphatidylserine decarboxylase family protein [Acidaminococcaceae bacterium]MBQ9256545.1 phosphatidylserine decarboxylase family protein [Acidaminococcaceae bacterium]MBQ9319770.1 phosphatidylserine decarboxylase family protein [Acidaminococcaceae bacterium]MBR1512109.1 phosphatidylserine decarboxylase family protein [Acidaminococcaceae bacterium]
MRIVKQGYPFIFAALLLAVIAFAVFGIRIAVIPLVLACYFAYFFRNPERIVEENENLLYSPADGTVMGVTEVFDDEFLNANAKKVTIFLSVFNVHVNRSPAEGTIKYQRYTVGHFLPAFNKNAAFENERFAMGIENGRMKMLVIQIAGILARRIDNWVNLGNHLDQGEVYGMIKFGSCTELIVPADVEILCKKGDKVKGGITVLGRVKA